MVYSKSLDKKNLIISFHDSFLSTKLRNPFFLAFTDISAILSNINANSRSYSYRLYCKALYRKIFTSKGMLLIFESACFSSWGQSSAGERVVPEIDFWWWKQKSISIKYLLDISAYNTCWRSGDVGSNLPPLPVRYPPKISKTVEWGEDL